MVAPLAYQPPVDHLIRRWKYHGQLHLGPTLAALWLAGCARSAETGLRPDLRVNWLVPVPLHRSRLRERGFNQSLELARCLSRQLGLPLATHWLHRRRASVPQSLLSAADRRRSQRGTFVADPALGQLAGARVALLDDVVTTGSTANACAEALLRAGAERVEVWAVSRA
ncbi:MAG: ComF family protein [Pseudomonadota bacterium]